MLHLEENQGLLSGEQYASLGAPPGAEVAFEEVRNDWSDWRGGGVWDA